MMMLNDKKISAAVLALGHVLADGECASADWDKGQGAMLQLGYEVLKELLDDAIRGEADKRGHMTMNAVTGWAVVARFCEAYESQGDYILWGPFPSEAVAEDFIEREGHLPEVVARWEEPNPRGLMVLTHPLYNPAVHLQFRREWDSDRKGRTTNRRDEV